LMQRCFINSWNLQKIRVGNTAILAFSIPFGQNLLYENLWNNGLPYIELFF